jgi:hypothetical protein
MTHEWPPKEPEAIRFDCIIQKVQTLVDGGIRLTLDLAGTDANTIMALINAKQPGISLAVAAVAINNEDD